MRLVGHILFWITAHQLSRNNFHFYWAEYLIGSICLFKNEYHTLQYCHEQRAPVHYKPSYKYSVCLFVYRRFWREIVKLYLLGVTRPPLKISKNISCFDPVCSTCYTSNTPILNILLKLIWNWRKPNLPLPDFKTRRLGTRPYIIVNRELKQWRFWATHVNRKWTFCTLEPWFWTHFWADCLYKN